LLDVVSGSALRSDPAAHTSREDAMPSKKKKKVADLPKKPVSSKKAETVKGGSKLNFSSKLQKSY
jgi:hypothetical protein